MDSLSRNSAQRGKKTKAISCHLRLCFAGESPTPIVPPILQLMGDQGQPMAVWVASTLDSIPPGSIIINPQTCKFSSSPPTERVRFSETIETEKNAQSDLWCIGRQVGKNKRTRTRTRTKKMLGHVMSNFLAQASETFQAKRRRLLCWIQLRENYANCDVFISVKEDGNGNSGT